MPSITGETEIRCRKLGYVELNVTDIARSQRFYQDIVGLEFVRTGVRGEHYFRYENDQHNVVLRPAAAAGLSRVGFMLEDDSQFEALAGRLARRRIAWVDAPPDELRARGLGFVRRIREPTTGVTLEFFAPEAPGEASFTPSLARIQRIGHVVVATPHIDAAAGFLTDALNFRVSDRIAGVATFMRCFPSPFHHGMAMVRGDRSRLHHVNFMVSEIDDIGRAIHRFRKHDVPIVFGPGRHPPSESVFLYYLDPDGLTLEYSFGIEQFPEHGARAPRVLPPAPESIDVWGSAQDPRCGARGEIEIANLD